MPKIRPCCSPAAKTPSYCWRWPSKPSNRGRPLKLPFKLLHVDTGHNYPEVIQFRDDTVARTGVQLVVGSVEESIRKGSVVLRRETDSRNAAQAVTLVETIEEQGFDALMGGARRDEEKSARQRTHLLFPRRVRPMGS